MDLARVVGNVWATQKDGQLQGLRLFMVQPVDINGKNSGTPFIAADTVGAGPGDTVYLTTAYEAVIPLENKPALCDASIVGIVDRLEFLYDAAGENNPAF